MKHTINKVAEYVFAVFKNVCKKSRRLADSIA